MGAIGRVAGLIHLRKSLMEVKSTKLGDLRRIEFDNAVVSKQDQVFQNLD